MNISKTENLMPREEMLEVIKSKKKLTIGIPSERQEFENRIALVPNAVGQLVRYGHRVIIENGAGLSSHFSDNEYSEEGGEIVYSDEEVYKSDIILKVAPVSDKESELIRKNHILISSLQINTQDRSYFKDLMDKKVFALAYELIRDETGSYPVLQAMSEIVGKAVIYIAAEYQSSKDFGKGNLFGGLPGIPPTEVVIIGAGTVGENAAEAALALGAQVKVFDNKIHKLRKLLKNINGAVFTSIMQPGILEKALKTADVVVGAYYFGESRNDCIITEEMIVRMKYRSLLVDVSIDQGGCFETSSMTTHNNPVFQKYDITHYCVPNIASKFARTASYALSNFFTPLLVRIGNDGGLQNLLRTQSGLGKGVYLYNGILTNKHIGDLFDLPSKDFELLFAAL